MGGWNDWIYIVPRPHPLAHRQEEVEREVQAQLADKLEARLRARIEPGVDLRHGVRGHAVRVAAEGNRLVIDAEDDHGLREAKAPRSRRRRARLEDLFHTSTDPPEPLEDGTLAFRVLHEEEFLSAQAEQDDVVDRTTQDVLHGELVEAYERAVKKVELEHPADQTR